jgi:hypothetical protein
MKPIKNEHTTIVLGAPQGWNADALGPCEGLPVVVEREGNHLLFFSYWRGTWRERLAVLFGRPVRLCVTGNAHPPVHLDTEPH